jgi:D-threonate/D-erythronate kinase
MIGVVADDLTGAAEIGAAGWRLGMHAEILSPGGEPGGVADLVCVDTDSRSCAPEEAAKRAAAAAAMLRASGASWIYKKVDSILRGNVMPEIEAMMKQLGLNRALLLPANPSLGRTIADGKYYIHGRPIHLTEFANDPQYPRKSPELLEMVARPAHFKLRLGNPGSMVPDNTVLIGQAEDSEQVKAWAAACDSSCLAVGGSEFFSNRLAGAPKQAAAMPIDFKHGPQLFICGTASESVVSFVKASREAGWPVFGLPSELATGAAFTGASRDLISNQVVEALKIHRRVILHIGLPQVRDTMVARELADHLVELASVVLRGWPVPCIFAEGGSTAAALVRQMHWPRLQVRYEWAPGVVTLAMDGERSPWLTIKPGSYAWPNEWTRRL